MTHGERRGASIAARLLAGDDQRRGTGVLAARSRPSARRSASRRRTVAARRAEDDDLGVAPRGLLDDRRAGAARADEAGDDRARRSSRASASRLVEELVGRRPRASGRSASSGRSSGTSSTCRSDDRRAPRSAASRAAATSASSDSAVRSDGHEDRPVLDLERGPSTIAGARTVSRSGSVTNAPPVDRVAGEAEREPAEPDPAGAGLLDDDDEPRDAGAEPAEDREERPVDARRSGGSAAPCRRAPRRGAGRAARSRDSVRDREREHRPERVHRPEEGRLARAG